MKHALFCLGTPEELNELQDCIRGLVQAGHTVYILHDFDPVPLLDQVGARVYKDALPFTAPFKDLRLDLYVVGHQCNLGKALVENGGKLPWLLYQGQHRTAGDWLDLHQHLFMVWGEEKECLRDWNDEQHDPWITGKWIFDFEYVCLSQLSDV